MQAKEQDGPVPEPQHRRSCSCRHAAIRRAQAMSCRLCKMQCNVSAMCEWWSMRAGLEVRVAFGEVWKESLTELSGGQRSLLALSLILAMLLFKPAPIYILDEVR